MVRNITHSAYTNAWAVLSGGDRNPMSEVIDKGVPSGHVCVPAGVYMTVWWESVRGWYVHIYAMVLSQLYYFYIFFSDYNDIMICI